MKISYIFPTRERPLKAIAAIENITSLARHPLYEIILTCDINDPSMCNDTMRDTINSFPNTKVYYGNSNTKIEAVNLNVPLSDGEIICVQSDDMIWQKDGFDLDILEGFSDGFKGLLHIPDQVAKDKLITYPIMHREYYELDHFIYHHDFISVYADNFQYNVAKARNKYKFLNKDLLIHAHPIWGFGEKDALLLKTEAPGNYEIDKQTFNRLTNEFHT